MGIQLAKFNNKDLEKKLTRPAFVTQAPELVEIYSAPVQQYLELFLMWANKIALK